MSRLDVVRIRLQANGDFGTPVDRDRPSLPAFMSPTTPAIDAVDEGKTTEDGDLRRAAGDAGENGVALTSLVGKTFANVFRNGGGSICM